MAIMAARALLVVTMAAAVLGTALGATYTVGAPSGSWDLRTNYDQWVSNINFRAGDQIGNYPCLLTSLNFLVELIDTCGNFSIISNRANDMHV